jgi:hypothetical protein
MIPVSGSSIPELVPLLERDIFGPTLNRNLVYARAARDTNIWRAGIDPPAAPQHLIASTHNEDMPHYSPDGLKIAFGSNRSGTRELWIATADGADPVQLTHFGGPQLGPATWSPDGRRLVFHARTDAQADLYSIASTGGAPTRLTNHPSDDLVPAYSHDGRWIYFISLRSGRRAIWRMPSAGGDATRITNSEGAFVTMAASDGKSLYYCHEQPEKGIWKLALDTYQADQIVTRYRPPLCGLAVTAEGVYYTAEGDADRTYSIDFLSFASGKNRPIVRSGRKLGGLALSVSPDRRFVIYGQEDQTSSDLMLVENFR